jgi:hypothetical protein
MTCWVEKGAFFRRDGSYSWQITGWRRAREAGLCHRADLSDAASADDGHQCGARGCLRRRLRIRQLLVSWGLSRCFDAGEAPVVFDDGDGRIQSGHPKRGDRVARNAGSWRHDRCGQSAELQSWAMAAADLPKLGAPATRALASIGVTRLEDLAGQSETELIGLRDLKAPLWEGHERSVG